MNKFRWLGSFLLISSMALMHGCGVKDYNGTGKSIYELNWADPIYDRDTAPYQQRQEAKEFVIDNSVLMEDVAWDYAPVNDLNVFGDNNSQLMLERETEEPPRLQFKDREFP